MHDLPNAINAQDTTSPPSTISTSPSADLQIAHTTTVVVQTVTNSTQPRALSAPSSKRDHLLDYFKNSKNNGSNDTAAAHRRQNAYNQDLIHFLRGEEGQGEEEGTPVLHVHRLTYESHVTSFLFHFPLFSRYH
jgi:hypothetical protein